MTTKRTDIIDEIKSRLETIREGQELSGEALQASVGLVSLGEIDVTELTEDELPAVQIIPDLPTEFEEGADGRSYLGLWRIALKLWVRNDTDDDLRDNRLWRNLEYLFRAVDLALHSDDFQLSIGPDVSFEMESSDPVAPSDEMFGTGAVILRID